MRCESGGDNEPPNEAGASGYYQFIVSTWQSVLRLLRVDGPPEAYLAPKSLQDRAARRLWNGGAGQGNWNPSDPCSGY